MNMIVLGIAVFVGVAALIVAVASMFQGDSKSAAEERLQALTSTGKRGGERSLEQSLLLEPLDDRPNPIVEFCERFLNLDRFIEQAGVKCSAAKLVFLSLGLAAAGLFGAALTPFALIAAPVAAVVLGSLPLLWLWWQRGRRMAKFGKQLPEALELLARALRAGHSLGAGFHLVSQEMPEPLGKEFARCFEEQNLGVQLEESLDDMTNRVPNLDLRFFATSVILQRTTGGDLAEILDKIGELVRERFRIWGQVQALTGEGRLSGIVLLALPPALFLVMLKLNFEYVMMLFNDPLGQKMLAGAIVSQVIGAIVIQKIVNIKV